MKYFFICSFLWLLNWLTKKHESSSTVALCQLFCYVKKCLIFFPTLCLQCQLFIDFIKVLYYYYYYVLSFYLLMPSKTLIYFTIKDKCLLNTFVDNSIIALPIIFGEKNSFHILFCSTHKKEAWVHWIPEELFLWGGIV